MRRFTAGGGVIQVAPVAPEAKRNKPGFFHGVAKSKARKKKDHSLETVEAVRGFAGAGVCAAAKALRMSTRTICAIAAAHRIDFGTTNARELEARYKVDDQHLPAIVQMIARRQSQSEISEHTGLSRTTLRRLLARHGLKTKGKRFGRGHTDATGQRAPDGN